MACKSNQPAAPREPMGVAEKANHGVADAAGVIVAQAQARLEGFFEMSDGQAWLDRATRTLSSADLVVNSDPEVRLFSPTTPDVRSAPASSLSRVCGPRPPAGPSP